MADAATARAGALVSACAGLLLAAAGAPGAGAAQVDDPAAGPGEWQLPDERAGADPGPEPVSGFERGVTRVRVEGELDVGMLSLLERASDQALGRRDLLLIELNTPGGRIDLMWRIAKAVDRASKQGITTVAWVNDMAASAGALVAMSCDTIYMRERASIGSATAITLGPGGVMPIAQDEDVLEKFNSSYRSQWRAWAEAHGRSEVLAEAMVDASLEVRQVRIDGSLELVSSKTWEDMLQRGERVELVRTVVQRGELLNMTGSEALELGFADGLAESEQELLAKLGVHEVAPTVVERTASDELASWLNKIAPLLFVAGLVLAYIELKVPGFGVPGILSVACFAVLLTGRYLVGLADVPHFVVVAVGFVLIALELFVFPGTLWAGISGLVLVVAGLIWAGLGTGVDFSNPFDQQLAIDSAKSLVLGSTAALIVMGVLSYLLPRTPIYGRIVSVPAAADGFGGALPEMRDEHAAVARPGARGRALTDLRPVGKVRLDEAPDVEHEARSVEGVLDAGTPVRVLEVTSGRLVVEAVVGEGATEGEGAEAGEGGQRAGGATE